MLKVEDIKKPPPAYQEQILKKIQDQKNQFISVQKQTKDSKVTKNKYRNQMVSSENSLETKCEISFRSKLERERYYQLLAQYKTGKIHNLKIQPQFTLVEGYVKPDGVKVRRMRYTADFSYFKDGKLVVEDVKSRPTANTAYHMRKTLMKDKYGIEITEVYSKDIYV